MGNRGEVAMKSVHSKLTITIPAGVTVDIKSRNVVVKGPRGTLTKSFKHMQIDLFKSASDTIQIEKWFALSKENAVLKTCSSHIQNMITGVTKGFKYRMKMVYAHFPTNAQIAGDAKSVDMVNFIGQKVKFNIQALDGVKIERDPKANTELLISGNVIESVSKTCALINQSCSVKRKDIRKFLDGVYVAEKGNIIED